jgi:hypothetical protein
MTRRTFFLDAGSNAAIVARCGNFGGSEEEKVPIPLLVKRETEHHRQRVREEKEINERSSIRRSWRMVGRSS